MPTRFRRYDPEQPLLLPPDLREWLSEAAEWMDQARIGISQKSSENWQFIMNSDEILK